MGGCEPLDLDVWEERWKMSFEERDVCWPTPYGLDEGRSFHFLLSLCGREQRVEAILHLPERLRYGYR